MQLPDSLLQSLAEEAGFDRKSFLEAHALPAPVSIRLNSLKKTEPPAAAAPVPWAATGFYLPERPVFTLDPLFHAGAYYVQEASSMFLERLLTAFLPDEGLRVLDLCAAPGGKSTLIANVLPEESLLVANEVIRPRSGVLADNLTKWGRTDTFVTNNDPRDFQRLPGFFDAVVVDAPCSGSGLFRKDPAAISEWSDDNVALCAQRQQRILADIWPALREDGLLIYSTCSYSHAENEAILDWLSSHFSVEPLALDQLPTGVVETHTARGNTGYRFWPDKVQGEGFFIAAFRKTAQESELRLRNLPKNKRKEENLFSPWIADVSDYTWVEKNGDYFLLQPEHTAAFDALSQHLYLRKAGVRLGKLAGKELLPDHEMALSVAVNTSVPTLPVDRDAALRYLKREEFDYDATGRGWQLVTFDGLGLGWVKVLSNRLNNYLPKDWRILMDIREN